jgi:hypothetical protein
MKSRKKRRMKPIESDLICIVFPYPRTWRLRPFIGSWVYAGRWNFIVDVGPKASLEALLGG